MNQVRHWAEQVGDALIEIDVDGETMLLRREDLDELRQTPPPAEEWPVRLLYRFEPYMLGYRDRDRVIDPKFGKAVFRPAGHIEGIVLAHGRGVGVWRYTRKASGLAINVSYFRRLPAYVRRRLKPLAKDVAAFFDLPLTDLTIAKLTNAKR